MTGLFQVPHSGAILVQCTKRAGVGFYSPPPPPPPSRPAPRVDLIFFPKLHSVLFEIKMAAYSRRSISTILCINGKLLIVLCGRILRIQLTHPRSPPLGTFSSRRGVSRDSCIHRLTGPRIRQTLKLFFCGSTLFQLSLSSSHKNTKLL